MSSSYVGPVYDPTDLVSFLHTTPRFGYSSDFAEIASTNNDEQLGYFYGAIFISVTVFVVFIAWALVLLLFLCLGQRQVGFLSGAKFVEPARGSYRRPGRVRFTVILACTAVIVFSVLLVTRGVNNVYRYASIIQSNTEQVKSIVDDTVDISGIMTEQMSETEILREKLVADDFLNACPDVGLDATSVLSGLYAMDDYSEDMTELNTESVVAQEKVDSFEDLMVTYVEWGWWQAIPIIAFMICSSLLLVGTVLAWAEVSCWGFQCSLTYLVLPIFSVLTIVSWLMAGIFAIGLIMNADMCQGGPAPGSPDATVVDVMVNLEMNPNTLMFTSVEYIVEGCRPENPFLFIGGFHESLASTASDTQDYLETWNGLSESEQSACSGNTDNLQSNLESLSATLNDQAENSLEAMSLLNCKRLNKIYVQGAHQGTCDYSVDALIWIFGSFLALGFCGMIVVTLRSAWKDTVRQFLSSTENIEMIEINKNTLTSENTDDPLGSVPQSSTETWERLPPGIVVGDVPPLLKGMNAEKC